MDEASPTITLLGAPTDRFDRGRSSDALGARLIRMLDASRGSTAAPYE
jgi:hypothetical protein